MGKFDLTGRKALVTGGARGLGAGMAEALAEAGASVMIGDILPDAGQATARRSRPKASRPASFRSTSPTKRAGARRFPRPSPSSAAFDILINNAGVEITSLVIDVKAADLRACATSMSSAPGSA